MPPNWTARERSGLDEAVITGEGMIRGRRVALIACEFAFLQMVKISAAVAAHKAAGLTYLVYLRNPTTGGVLASWGSLGHVTVAEPGALVGFFGPRVYEALYSETFPPGVRSRRTSSRTVWWTPSCPRRIWRPSPTGR